MKSGDRQILEAIRQLIFLLEKEGEKDLAQFLNYIIAPLFQLRKHQRPPAPPISAGWRQKGKSLLSAFKQKFSATEDVLIDKHILFFPDEANHIQQQLPVYQDLLAKKHKVRFVFTKPSIGKLLDSFGLKAQQIQLKSFISDIPVISTNLAEKIKQEEPDLALLENLNAINALIKRLSRFKSLQHKLEQILDNNRPKALVVGYDLTPAGRIITVLGKQRGIPTFCIQHGNITGNNILMQEHVVDCLLVHGKIPKRKLLELGCKAEIEISGPPGLKKILEGIKETSRLSTLAGNFEKRFLIAFSGAGNHTSSEHLEAQIQAIVALSKIYSQHAFLFKLHPKDSKAKYIAYQDHSNIFVYDDKDLQSSFSIFDWIQACDAVITGNSNVAHEAMLLQKPVFTLDFQQAYQQVAFIQQGATIHSTSLETLQSRIQEFLESPEALQPLAEKAARYIEDYFTDIERATENCAELILDKSKVLCVD